MKKSILLSTLVLISAEATETNSKEMFQTSGQFRTGYIEVSNNGTKNSTLATGGQLSLKTKTHENLAAKVSLSTLPMPFLG